MAGELITADRQVELSGLVMGPGTDYEIVEFNPWVFPEVTSSEIGRPQTDGLIGGVDLIRGKRVPGVIAVTAHDPASAERALSALKAAWRPQPVDVPLVWRSGGEKKRILGRPKLADPTSGSAWMHEGTVMVEVRFLATDPLIYSDTEQSASTAFPVTDDGFTFDFTFDLTFGDVGGDGGVIVAHNAGVVDAPWRAEITGPWVNPTIRRLDSGEQLTLTINVGVGDVLRLDSRTETVTLNGAQRLTAVQPGSVWPALEPGSNDIRFGGSSGSGLATLLWRSAYL